MKWRKRRHGDPVPYWFAKRKAVEMGYPVKSANLSEFAYRPAELYARCVRLETEMKLFMRAAPRIKPGFDGTFGSLITVYETDPESTFHALKPNVKDSYMVYVRRLRLQLGEVTLNDSDGTDAKRWFRGWQFGTDGKDRVPRARFALAVLKAAISFGVMRRFAGVKDFQDALSEVEFPGLKRRTQAPTAAQLIAVRQAAIAAGAHSRALVYSLQFEPTIRQWDLIGVWLPMSAPQPSLIHNSKNKWIGLMWSAIDDNGILRLKPTEDTTEVEGVFDLSVCPMVQEDLARIPLEQRKGPLIINHETGLPYSTRNFTTRGDRTSRPLACRKNFGIATFAPAA